MQFSLCAVSEALVDHAEGCVAGDAADVVGSGAADDVDAWLRESVCR